MRHARNSKSRNQAPYFKFGAPQRLTVKLAMFSAAFDASGTDATPVLTVAGFISSVKEWDDFSTKWEERLAVDGISYFRAVEFAHSRGQFQGWEDQKSRHIRLSSDLMEILIPHVCRKVGCTIINKDFETLSKDLQDDYTLTAYSLAGRTCEVQVRSWKRLERIEGHVEPIFEEGDADQEKLRRRLAHDLGYEPIFRPKKDVILADGSTRPRFVPLQAADWLAYELSLAAKKYGMGELEGRLESRSDLRWPMQEFNRIQGEPVIYGAEEIRKLESDLGLLREHGAWWNKVRKSL